MEASNFSVVPAMSKVYDYETPTHPTSTTPAAHGEEILDTNPLANPLNCSRKLHYGELRQALVDADTNGKRKISIEDHHEDTGNDAKRSRRGRSRSRSLSLSILRSASKKITPAPQTKSQSRQWSRKFSRKFTLRSQKPHVVGRKSRFIEASMHDRPSERPPSIFMREARATECAMEQYMADEGGDEDWEDSDESPQPYDAGIEAAKPSAIWGLGKALVNVFNPLNVWQGLNGMFKEKESQPEQKPADAEGDLLTQQRKRAEQAYIELKMSEYRGRQELLKQRHSVDVPSTTKEEKLKQGHSVDVPSATNKEKSKQRHSVDVPSTTNEEKLKQRHSVDVPSSTNEKKSKQGHSVDVPSATNEEKLKQRHSVDVPSIINEEKLRRRPSVRVPSTGHGEMSGQRPSVRVPSFPYDGNLRYPHSVYVPCTSHEITTDLSHPASPRDSGVDVDGYRSSSERQGDRIAFDPDVRPAPPAPVPFGRPASPFPDVKSLPRSSLHLRKPSLLSLKKVKSHLQLPSLKRDSAPSTRVPSMESDLSTQSGFDGQAVRKQLSKKDLHKQLKLSKKVSNLESKLEKTRRDLKALTQEDDVPPVPSVPKTFVPGALASLPSERLLFEEVEVRVMPLADDDVFVEEVRLMPLADDDVFVEKEEYDWGEDVF